MNLTAEEEAALALAEKLRKMKLADERIQGMMSQFSDVLVYDVLEREYSAYHIDNIPLLPEKDWTYITEERAKIQKEHPEWIKEGATP